MRKLLSGRVDVYEAKVIEEAEEVVRAAGQEGKTQTIEEVADCSSTYLCCSAAGTSSLTKWPVNFAVDAKTHVSLILLTTGRKFFLVAV